MTRRLLTKGNHIYIWIITHIYPWVEHYHTYTHIYTFHTNVCISHNDKEAINRVSQSDQLSWKSRLTRSRTWMETLRFIIALLQWLAATGFAGLERGRPPPPFKLWTEYQPSDHFRLGWLAGFLRNRLSLGPKKVNVNVYKGNHEYVICIFME